jgi:hypothetical protein
MTRPLAWWLVAALLVPGAAAAREIRYHEPTLVRWGAGEFYVPEGLTCEGAVLKYKRRAQRFENGYRQTEE